MLCELADSALRFELPPYPFQTSLHVSAPRMDIEKRWTAIKVMSSDEVALLLAQSRRPDVWALVPLYYEFPAAGNLLDMTVVGNDEEFNLPEPKHRARIDPSAILLFHSTWTTLSFPLGPQMTKGLAFPVRVDMLPAMRP